MIEVIACYSPMEPKGFIKGHIMFLNHTTNECAVNDNIYTDKYSFALYVMIKFWNEKYRWKSIKIHFKHNVIEMKGEINEKNTK